ncbi:aldo/keto reductase [Demequina sp. NBRC 110056]|uniref:aldo/keto reductase n=1 Tax=Demequina sp. NBRC 110056 TaxID=1570345 RepID=UPI00190ED1F5|nr:aldo/keto reductase [Demequina sp. NBRC 110056]
MNAPDVADRRALGRTDLEVTPVSIGTASWGPSSPDHGVVVTEDEALAAAARVMDGPFNVLDTSNNYGGGESERRIGRAIAARGGLPQGFVLQTKVDRDPATGTFDADRVRRSFEESLDRLGLDRVPSLLLHDPEHLGFAEAARPRGPLDALVSLRDEGLTDVIGVGGGPASMLLEFVRTDLLDVVLTHNRFTLVDRTADALITEAHQRGMGVLNGAVFAGGVLATHPRTSSLYGYAAGDPRLLGTIDAMGRACAEAGVPIAAAALQWSLRDERITSTVCGVGSAAQVDEIAALAAVPIPADLWNLLDDLAPRPDLWRND